MTTSLSRMTNSEHTETYMKDFINTYDLKHLVKEPTCYKNPMNPLA